MINSITGPALATSIIMIPFDSSVRVQLCMSYDSYWMYIVKACTVAIVNTYMTMCSYIASSYGTAKINHLSIELSDSHN